MATEAQIAANRANALKSTGPRTPEGKAQSSRNALRHGLLAATVLTKAECREAFNRFVEGFHAEFQPCTATEAALVDAMATARWRAMRLTSFEAVQIDREFDRQRDPSNEGVDNATRTGLAYGEAVTASRILESIGRGESRVQHQFNSAFDRLSILLDRRRKRYADCESREPPPADPPTKPMDL